MKKIFILAAASIGLHIGAQAQGCSDAGICYASTHQAVHSDSSSTKNTLEVGYVFGKGLVDVMYHNGLLTYTRAINSKFNVMGRVTYNQASGNFGTLGLPGDLMVNGIYTISDKNDTKVRWTLGGKIPFTRGNRKINGFALPMDYQPSLGTFDVITNVEYQIKKWVFDAGIQIPLVQNRNSYFDEFSASMDFPTTNLFQRKSDALLRAAYVFQTKNKKMSFRPNVLAIYHLGEDSFENTMGQRQNIKGSDGLTLNANIITNFMLSKKTILELNLATPLVVREIRPDGLTRALTAGVSFKYAF